VYEKRGITSPTARPVVYDHACSADRARGAMREHDEVEREEEPLRPRPRVRERIVVAAGALALEAVERPLPWSSP
jgi:hypothetical protein